MRYIWVSLIALTAFFSADYLHAETALSPRPPIVLELFTSEGCSSCPPADDLLRSIETKGEVDGIPVVVLGEHVEYWDHDGWRDNFSSSQATLRQTTYKSQLHFASEFTPQVIVNGQFSVLGSDPQALQAAVRQAAAEPEGVSIHLSAPSTDFFEISVGGNTFGKIDVLLAIIETGLVTDVHAGENRDRHLAHAGVVRKLILVTRSKESSLHTTVHMPFKPQWDKSHLRAVAFAQAAASGKILGAATLSQLGSVRQ